MSIFAKGLSSNKWAKIGSTLLAVFLSSVVSSSASAVPIASATLTSFDQNGLVINSAASGADITSIVYDLGAAFDGGATWDSNGGLTVGGVGAVTSNHLSNANYFQTVSWSGLSIAAGDAFSFGSLDIDLISTLSPLSVTGSILDNVGTSLANATFSVFWSNGMSDTVSLTQQAWSQTQNLTLKGATAVPAPASMAMIGLGLIGLTVLRKKNNA